MIEITLPMPPSANHIWRSGRSRVYRSDKYKSWMHDALWIIGKVATIPSRVDVEIELCNTGRGDADNRNKAVLDALVKAGLLANDSKKHVRGVHTFWSDDNLGGDIVVRVVPVACASSGQTAEGQRERPTRTANIS